MMRMRYVCDAYVTLLNPQGAIEELEHRLENKEHLFEHVNESHFILAEVSP